MTMYEMYPDAWSAERRQPPAAEAKPRRRARKAHPIVVAPGAIQIVPERRDPEVTTAA